jgi:hypothetical protein
MIMKNFLFTTLKNHRPVQIRETNQYQQSTSVQQRSIQISQNTISRNINNNMLTRNIFNSQPIFSVSSIFGLKQGSCRSCGH